MPLLADCEKYFGTKSLYEVLNLTHTKKAPVADDKIKKAYYRLSLEFHPDRCQLEDATQRFQTINKVYGILGDKEKRELYDEAGVVDDEDVIGESCDLVEAFRRYFRIVTPEEMDKFKAEYQGSEAERLDAKENFEKVKGDMDVFYEYQVCSDPLEDEEKFRTMFNEMIEKEEVEAYDAFVKETDKKRLKRKRKWEKERKEVEEMRAEKSAKNGASNGDLSEDQLAMMIRQKNANRMDDMADMLAAKYGGAQKSKKKKK